MDHLGQGPGSDQINEHREPLRIQPDHTAQPSPKPVPVAGLVISDGIPYAPAGFWLRFMAFMVDMLILGTLSSLILRIVNLPPVDLGKLLEVYSSLLDAVVAGGFPSLSDMAELNELQRPAEFAGWVHVAMCCAYFTIFHGLMGASPGKLCLGIKLLSKGGKEIGLGLAFLRYLAYLLVARLAYTAWVMPFDSERRTLYDMALRTNVYKRVGVGQGSNMVGSS